MKVKYLIKYSILYLLLFFHTFDFIGGEGRHHLKIVLIVLSSCINFWNDNTNFSFKINYIKKKK